MNTKLPREALSRLGEPTEASPGSPSKIRVLTERASRRESLFHPADNLLRQLPMSQPEPEESFDNDMIDMAG
jgi:hypothetical protein